MKNETATLRGVSNLEGLEVQSGDATDINNQGVEQLNDNDKQDNQELKTYTQEEVDKLLQSEADRRVTEALKTARAKWEKEFREKLEKEKKEAERLSKLSAEEREKELLKQKEQELAEKEKAIRMKELHLDTIEVLAQEGLPVGFAEFLIQGDAETTNENIKKFKKEWQEALSKAVDERIKGKSPRLSETKLESEETVDFMKLASEASIRKL
jgi:transketolase